MMDTNRAERRNFLKRVSGAAAAGIVGGSLAPATAQAKTPNGFKKAVKIGMVKEGSTATEKFKLLKELGFDGVEPAGGMNRDELIAARDASGLTIPGVVVSGHWKDTLSHPDPAVRKRGLNALKRDIKDAKAYGATSVLLVPAVVNKEVSYDDAYKRSQVEIRKAIPLAEDLGINILIENVWNNFLLSPLEEARYIDELDSKMVGAHFDVGNVIMYGWPEQWIRILGKRIRKLDIKEFSRKKLNNEGRYKGFNVKLLEGDNDWPAVMRALRDVGYVGWGTAEIPGGKRDRLKEIAERMDKIFAS